MHEPIEVQLPGGFAPAVAMGHDGGTRDFALVSEARPLPTRTVAIAEPSALAGSASVARTAGPFVPVAGKPVILALSGEWQGTARLLRSTDGGATLLPLTIARGEWGPYSANACEPVWEESEDGASLWLELAPTGGTIARRVSQ